MKRRIVIDMGNSKYVKGAAFERAFIHSHKDCYQGVRSAGSHTPVDIVLISPYKVVLAQLKRYSKGSRPKPTPEFKALRTPPACVKWWVTRKDREQVKVEVVL